MIGGPMKKGGGGPDGRRESATHGLDHSFFNSPLKRYTSGGLLAYPGFDCAGLETGLSRTRAGNIVRFINSSE